MPSHLVVQLHGRYGTGRRSLIGSVCEQQGLRLLRVDAAKLVGLPAAKFEETLRLLVRESMLQPSLLCIENVDPLVAEDGPAAQGLKAIAQAIQIPLSVTILVGQRPWSPEGIFRDGVFQSIELGLPDRNEARRIWTQETRC